MPQPQVQVQGLAQLRRTLRKAGHDLSDMADVNAAVAGIIVRAQAARAPRRTGALAASPRPSRAKGRARVLAGGARVPYAGPIHWGWPARNISPQPWLSETAQATEPAWVDEYRRGVTDILTTVKGA